MDFPYKMFDYELATFPGLEKHADNDKYYGQHMAVMCIIKKSDPQELYHLCNDLENGTILGEYADMYPKTIAKAYDVICK